MCSSTDPIGIIGAMQVEVDTLISNLQDPHRLDRARTSFFEGHLCGKPVVVVRSGVGKVNASSCAQMLIDYFGVSSIINTGIAGALASDLAIGDVVVASDCVEHDMDVTNLSYPKGQIPDMDVLSFSADPALAEAIEIAAHRSLAFPHVYRGRIASGDQFIHTCAQKEAIYQEFGALCCEMEGAAIAHVCYLHKLPFAVVRTISDTADECSHLDYPSFEKKTAYANAQLVELVLSSL